ncbi:glycosyltransferase [Conexibacter woesei]|uniref:glycosyltransferase n=1 Tax=Conexibacter woesei TaxID=191495 RepID=UPI0004172764|nr:glycosyltransferase [Conexibacter woesei]
MLDHTPAHAGGRDGAAMTSAPAVAITHDFMEIYGGAERVTQELASAFPGAPLTAVLGRRSVAARMGVADRFTSVLPPRELLLRGYRVLAPALPAVVHHHRLDDADVVLSSSYAFAHLFETRNDAPQVCYCHSPLRFAWSMTEHYEDEKAAGSKLTRTAFRAMAAHNRRVDYRGAQHVHTYLTQSPYVAGQIEEFYGRRALVVGAPVDCSHFTPSGTAPEDYWLICGRLVEPYKRVTLALEAFRDLPGERLVIAGDGPAMAELQAKAPPNVTFLGHLEDDAVVKAMQNCKATIFPSRDDFGLIPVEVAACGRPVLAYGDGGALHTVVPGLTGEHFHEQTAGALLDALRAFDPGAYDPAAIRAHALKWDRAPFTARVQAVVAAVAAGTAIDEAAVTLS